MAGELQGDVQAGLVQLLSDMRLGLEDPPSPISLLDSDPACSLLLPLPHAFRYVGSFLCVQSHAGSAQPAEAQPVPKLQRKFGHPVGG